MSRRHDFPARGTAVVTMTCDNCDLAEEVSVEFWGDEDPCFATLAADQSSWRYTHDAFVCSQECAEHWWEWKE